MKKTGFWMALAAVVSLAFSASAQDSSWKKARTLTGIAYNSGDTVCGWIDLKCGKAGKGNTAKVSGKLTLLGGKSITLAARTVQAAATVSVSFPIDGSTPLNITITGDSFSGSQEAGAADPIRVETGSGGGGLSNTSEPTISAEYDTSGLKLPEGFELMDELLPDGQSFTISGKKWTFGKAAKPRYKKVKEDGITTYELTGVDFEDDDDDDDDDDDEDGKKKKKRKAKKKRTNVSGMKLTYNEVTGTFKGTFKVYATNEFSVGDKKPKLKKYTARVAGMVVDGYGFGSASVAKLGLSLSVVIE